MKASRSGETGEAKAGTIASSSGSAMVAPRPRRMARRESCLVRIGHYRFDELGERFVTGSRSQGELAAESVGHQLRTQDLSEAVLIVEQHLFEVFGVRIDGSAPSADGIVVFEVESQGVHASVTDVASWIGAVLLQALAHGGPSSEARFIELGNIGRRWRRRGIEQILQNPFSPKYGRGARGIRSDGQNAGLRQDAAAMGIRWEFDETELRAIDAGDVIKSGQALI